MINTVIGSTNSPEIFSPFAIAFIGGVICTILGTVAGYIQGRDVSRVESNKFWAMQNKIKDKDAQARREKKLKECEKGWETRRNREVAIIVNRTECDK